MFTQSNFRDEIFKLPTSAVQVNVRPNSFSFSNCVLNGRATVGDASQASELTHPVQKDLYKATLL